MTSRARPGAVLAVLFATALLPAAVFAQPVPPTRPAFPGAEHFAVGAVGGLVPGAIPWGIFQVRIEAPVGRRWMIDGDFGPVLGTNRIDTGQIPTGAAIDLHVKWLYAGRQPGGRAAYVFAGPRVIGARNVDQRGVETDRRSIKVVDIGYGIDWIQGRSRLKGGWHMGFEVAAGVGGSPLVIVNGFLLFGPRGTP
jgi:hypothetical protein